MTLGYTLDGKPTPERNSWNGMKARRLRYLKHFKHDEELFISFKTFLDHVGLKPFHDAKLDRENNNLGYVFGNLRWVTSVDNSNNRNNTLFITAFGETKPAAEWARQNNTQLQRIHKRLAAGWSSEDAVSTKFGTGNQWSSHGNPRSIT